MKRFMLAPTVAWFMLTVGCGEDTVVLHIEGEVVSVAGDPLEGGTVELYEMTFGGGRPPLAKAITNADGEYQIVHDMDEACMESLLLLRIRKRGYITKSILRVGVALGNYESHVRCVSGVQRIDVDLMPE